MKKTNNVRDILPRRLRLLLMTALLLASHASVARLNVDVRIEGVSGELLNNVRTYLSVEQQKSDPYLTPERLRRLNHKADEQIKQALQPFGYYHPVINKALKQENGQWTATYDIQPGRPVRIRTVDLKLAGQGAQDPEFQRLLQSFPLRRGDILNQQDYSKAKSQFQNLALERGYFDFHFTRHQIQVDMAANTAIITLHMDSGPRHRFGAVTFKQNFLNDSLLQRFVPFKPGDPYSTDNLLSLQGTLANTDYFSSIDVKTLKDHPKGLQVPIEVDVKPSPRNHYTAGIGYGTDTGARGTLGWDIRHINRRGHHMHNTLQLSELQDAFSSRYIIPIRNPRTDSFSVNSSLSRINTVTSQSKVFSAGPSVTIGLHSGWLQTAYINFQREVFTVDGQSGTANMLIPGITWMRINAKDRIYTRHGSKISLDLKGAPQVLFSDISFVQALLHGKLIRGIGPSGRVILRGDLGLTSVGDFSKLPATLRFFSGGAQSVRGYAYDSLGARNSSGQVIGGAQLVVGSIEYDHKIVGKWSAGVFYDIGNAIVNFSTPLKQGAGFGIRWRSPVGMLRFDIAWALSTPGTPIHLHFNMGPDL